MLEKKWALLAETESMHSYQSNEYIESYKQASNSISSAGRSICLSKVVEEAFFKN